MQAPGTRRGPVLWVVILTTLIVAIMVYLLGTGSRMAAQYPLMDAAMEIKIEAGLAHLRFEETIRGDRREGISRVWGHLDQSEWYARAMLQGGENAHGVFVPLDDPALRSEIEGVLAKIERFRGIAEKRWAMADQAGIGSTMDEGLDAVFEDFVSAAGRVEAALKRAMEADLARFRSLQGFLIALCLGLSVFVGVVLIRIERQRADRMTALRESEQRFRTIFEQAAIGVALIESKTGRFLRANQRYCDMLGLTPEEMAAGRTFLDITHPEDLWPAGDNATGFLAGEAREVGVEKRHFHKDGSIVWVNLSLSPTAVTGEASQTYIAVAEDISERKRVEQEQLQIEARLRQQQKLEAMGTLAGGIAHEINNPINGIMNYARLIDERLDANSLLREFAREIGHETERVAGIVRNLLSFARQEKDSHSPADMADIVNSTVSLIRTVIRRDQIALEVDMPEGLPKLKCRSQQIQQVLMNLLTNARDALNERYPDHHLDKAMTLRVRLYEKEGRRWLRTTVEDHGTGIREDVRSRLFDPFFTTKDRTKGTGLGLSISHGIVRDHHGELSVECQPGQYTRFHVDLPVDNNRDRGEAPAGTQ